jgi:hypothetical protein
MFEKIKSLIRRFFPASQPVQPVINNPSVPAVQRWPQLKPVESENFVRVKSPTGELEFHRPCEGAEYPLYHRKDGPRQFYVRVGDTYSFIHASKIRR